MSAEDITINVKTLNSNVYSITVPKNISVPELKKKIEQVSNVSADIQRLIFQGKAMTDDKTAADFGLETGQTLHMVERKPQVQATTPNPPPNTNTAPTQQRNFVAFPNMVMGTISIPNDGTPPPINQIIGSLLNTINGVPVTNTAAPQSAVSGTVPPTVTANPPGMVSNVSAPDRHAHVRQFLNTLDQQLTQLGVAPGTLQETSNDTHLLERVSAALTRVSQALTRRNEVTQNNAEKIRQLQQIVHQLGIMLTLVSPNMGTLIDPNYVPPANNTNVTPHMQVYQIATTDAGADNSNANTAQNTMHMNIPLITIRRQGNVAPPTGPAANNSAANTNANPLMQMMNSMMQSFVPPPNTAAAPNTAAPSGTVPPSATLNMMNNPTGAMLNQMFSAVNQLMTAPQQSATLTAAVSAMNPAASFDSSSDAVSWVLQAVMDHMTVPELLALMAGQWTCWDHIQPLLRQRWMAEQLPRLNSAGHVTDAQHKFAEQLQQALEVQVRNTVLPNELKQQLPNNAHVSITVSALAPSIKSFVQWCTSEGADRSGALRALVHSALVQWVRALSAELDAGVESAALVIRHIVTALVHMDQLPAELMTMSSTMITDYVLRVYAANSGSSVPSVLNNNNNNAEPLPVIPGVPTDWNDIVARDVQRQEKQREQDPFSDAYAADHPHPNKKRKILKNAGPSNTSATAVSEQLLEQVLHRVAKKLNAQTPPAPSSLTPLYIAQLQHDMTEQARSHPDFPLIADRFPNLKQSRPQ